MSHSRKLIKPEEGVVGTSDLQLVKSTGNNLDLRLVSEEGMVVLWDWAFNQWGLMLSPCSVKIDINVGLWKRDCFKDWPLPHPAWPLPDSCQILMLDPARSRPEQDRDCFLQTCSGIVLALPGAAGMLIPVTGPHPALVKYVKCFPLSGVNHASVSTPIHPSLSCITPYACHVAQRISKLSCPCSRYTWYINSFNKLLI